MEKQAFSSTLEVSDHETLEPTPDILDALEKAYPLEASIADLLDNSIDARATKVLVRFVKSDGRLQSLLVVDNGKGMSARTLRSAMQFGARRKYGRKDLGMFGVGLKTASLSQAQILTVISKAAGNIPVGRQWTRDGIKKHHWTVNILHARSVNGVLLQKWGHIGKLNAGTVVIWDRVNDFDRLRSQVGSYLEDAIKNIRRHLGLKLHRFLERKRVSIHIEIEDLDVSDTGPPTEVNAINPFPVGDQVGARGFPKQFVARIPGEGRLTLTAHIWRRRSTDPGYKLRLGRGNVAEHQGFYFYRHDRLIQDGGWCGLIGTNEPHLSLARVEVDIPDGLRGYLKVRSDKNGVDVPASFGDAIFAAKGSDGTDFRQYVRFAEEVYRRKGKQKARPMLQPGAGVPAEVRNALEREDVRFVSGAGCSIMWDHVSGSDFFEVNREKRLIVLNRKYRSMLLRGARGGKTDLPLLRTLLFFTFESLLAGARIGAVERLRLEAIQSAMNAALKLEKQWARK